MLYVTTRSDRDAFTAQRVVNENRGPDGGLFIPFRDPQFTAEEINALQNLSFSKCIANVLNKLFHVRLTFRDVELAAGRYPVRLKKLNQRLIIGECWHNLESELLCTIKNLTNLIRSHKNTDAEPGEWTAIDVFPSYSEFLES